MKDKLKFEKESIEEKIKHLDRLRSGEGHPWARKPDHIQRDLEILINANPISWPYVQSKVRFKDMEESTVAFRLGPSLQEKKDER